MGFLSILRYTTFLLLSFYSLGYGLMANDPIPTNMKKGLEINIICWDNGVGQTSDFKILQTELSALGHQVNLVDVHPSIKDRRLIPTVDVNIFLEHVYERMFCFAKKNYFIPNPEWGRIDQKVISKLDLILCRTHEVQRIFHSKTPKTHYIGFTSIDRYKQNVLKEFDKFFHLRGKSTAKGTAAVLETWKTNCHLPVLTLLASDTLKAPQISNVNLINTYVDEKKVVQLLNTHGIHLCPSETEGFGHYLSEALSVGAVVITTDAPPMNEFITDPRCLVKYYRTENTNLATSYFVDPNDLKLVVENLLKLSPKELNEIGKNNRKKYLESKRAFQNRLKDLFGEVQAPQTD